MPHYPDIARICPIADSIDTVMDGSFCRRCCKTVTDLDAMRPAERYRMIADSNDDVCVRYRMPARAVIAAAAMMAAGLALPAAAQDASANAVEAAPHPEEDEVIVGSMRILTPTEQERTKRKARWAEIREKRAKRRAEKAARTPAS